MTGSDDLSVGDLETMRTRLLARMCDTCVFRPGKLMHLRQSRPRGPGRGGPGGGSYIVCHSTLPGMAPEGVQPAVCRRFADRYHTQSLQVIERLFGFTEVEPPPGPDA